MAVDAQRPSTVAAAYQQMQRWMRAGCFERIVEDVQSLLRQFAGRKGQPTAAVIDSRTLQSTPENGARAGYDRAKRLQGIQGAYRGRYAGPPAGADRDPG